MHETVSVYQAIIKGHRTVTYPSVVVMLGLLFGSFTLSVSRLLPFWTLIPGFLLAFVACWLYWSVMITRWRLWAFDRVRNVHQLQESAVTERLIWPEGSFFEKTEVRNFDQKQRWLVLQEKFKVADIFVDDAAMRQETIIFYSRKYYSFILFFLLLVGGLGLFAGIKTDSYLPLIGPAFVAIPAVSAFRKYASRQPQITLKEQGIHTMSSGFHEWKSIQNEYASIHGHGKHARSYFSFDSPGGHQRMRIDGLSANVRKLNHLLQIYRGRYEQQAKSRQFKQVW